MNQPITTNDSPLNASGRFGRLAYLAWIFLSSILVSVILGIAIAVFGMGFNPEDPNSFSVPAIIVFVAVYLAFLYYTIIFAIRRLHDRNHTGWLVLLIFVPVVNLIFALYLLFAKGDEGRNNFGPKRENQSWEKVLGWIYIIFVIGAFVLGIIAAIAMPSYQSYVEESQTTSIDEETSH